MDMKLQLPRGTRDVDPGRALVRNQIVATIKNTFEQYGFAPLDTPTFERFDILSSKYAGGAEILKETFKFNDQGKRELALRYDLTVPLCRYIGMNPTLKLPFKRYQIGDVYRDGPVATARYRQFTQCDVDIIGAKTGAADAELVALAARTFGALKLPYSIRINNRKVLNDLLAIADVPADLHEAAILSIDKLAKLGEKAVRKELEEKGIDKKTIEKVFSYITITGNNKEKIKQIKKLMPDSEGIAEIEELFLLLEKQKIAADFDVSLARGLSYYTGTVIEMFLKGSKVESSVCGGGRYDEIIGKFLGKGEMPAVGISFGLDRIYDAYVENRDVDQLSSATAHIAPINTFEESFKLAERLRDEGINTSLDLSGRSITKNLKYANTLGIPFVVIVGENELKNKKAKVKNMKTGGEEDVDLDKIGKVLLNA